MLAAIQSSPNPALAFTSIAVLAATCVIMVTGLVLAIIEANKGSN